MQMLGRSESPDCARGCAEDDGADPLPRRRVSYRSAQNRRAWILRAPGCRTWCDSRGGLCAVPATAESVAAYIAGGAGRLKPGSIQRRLNAIAEAHKAAGLESPTHAAIVRNTLKGIRRTKGTAPAQKTAALTD